MKKISILPSFWPKDVVMPCINGDRETHLGERIEKERGETT